MVRLVAVVAVVATAGLVALFIRVAHHPPVSIAGLAFPPGIVIFTSTDCRRCKETLATVKGCGVPVREVTFELEPNLQEEAGIIGVPLTLVIDKSGMAVAQIAGRVRPQTLARAIRRADL